MWHSIRIDCPILNLRGHVPFASCNHAFRFRAVTEFHLDPHEPEDRHGNLAAFHRGNEREIRHVVG